MVNFTFDKNSKIIVVDLPATEVTVQEIVNAVRDWSDELQNLEIKTFMFPSGKEDLGGEVLVGITVVLVEWKLKFADRPGPNWVICKISGGNFVGTDAFGNEQVAVEPAAYVTVLNTASSSATIIVGSGIGSVWSEAEKDQVISDIDGIETTVAGIDIKVDLLQTTIDEVHLIVSGMEVTLSGADANTNQILSLVNEIKDASWNKKVLTKINDNLYKEELYDDAGSIVIRTHRLSKAGDVETRENW